MGRHDSAVACVTAIATALFGVIGALGAVPAVAAAPSMLAAPDLLEPAKSALRLKQFADAAGRLAADPLAADPRAQYLLGTLYLAGLGVGEDTQRARTLFTAAAAKGEPRAAYALAALAAHDSPATNRRHGAGSQRPRQLGMPMRRACCRQASCHCKWIPVSLQPNPQ